MTQIIIGTTPTITYKFKIVSPSDFRTAILTIKKQSETIIEKTLADATIGEDSLSWTLTQQETLNIGTRFCKMMLNWVTYTGKRGASEETAIQGINNLSFPVIDKSLFEGIELQLDTANNTAKWLTGSTFNFYAELQDGETAE